MAEFENLEQFEVKIKEQLNSPQFNADFSELKEFLNQFGGLKNQGVRLLIGGFYEMIQAEERPERKEVLFKDLVEELRAHLARRKKIIVSQDEFDSRQRRLRNIREELEDLNSQIVSLESEEIGLDELGKEENNVVITIEKLQSKVLKLMQEKANLENKYLYWANDLDFGDITDSTLLNELLSNEILTKFKKDLELPNFEDVEKLVESFASENQVSLSSKGIFEKICVKLKFYRRKGVEYSLDSYLNDKNLSKDVLMPTEDEELKKKLDSQNTFRTKINELVLEYLEKKEPTLQSDSEDEPIAEKVDEVDEIICISSSDDDLPVTRSAKDDAVQVASGYEEIEILSDDEKEDVPVDESEKNGDDRESSERAAEARSQSSKLSESRPETTNDVSEENEETTDQKETDTVEAIEQTEENKVETIEQTEETAGHQDRSTDTIEGETAESEPAKGDDLLKESETSEDPSANDEEPACKRKTDEDSSDESAKKSRTEEGRVLLD